MEDTVTLLSASVISVQIIASVKNGLRTFGKSNGNIQIRRKLTWIKNDPSDIFTKEKTI